MFELTMISTIFPLILLIVFSPLILALLLIGLQKKVNMFYPATGMIKTGYVGYLSLIHI